MSKSENDILNIIKGLLLLGLLIYVGWAIAGIYGYQQTIKNLIGWIVIGTIAIIGIVSVILIGWGAYEDKKEKEREEKRKKKAQKMRGQGKVKYRGRWMKPEEKKARKSLQKFDELWEETEDPQIKSFKKRAKKSIENGDFEGVFRSLEKAKEEAAKKVYRVVERIKEFEPAKGKFGREEKYQLNLHGWLKSEFPSAEIEETRSSSRPDITIGEIAIEVKGPTYSQDLRTISDKVMRYMQNFEELIVVLFNVNVTDRRYKDWKNGMKNSFPNVKIIRLDFD